MGKNKKSKIAEYSGITFDSNEELIFFYWLEEAIYRGFIKYYVYQPDSYILSDDIFKVVLVIKKKKIKKEIITSLEMVNKKIINGHIYSPDFKIEFSDLFLDYYKNKFYSSWSSVFKNIDDLGICIIDIKGTFARNGGERSFSINQKWVYQKYGVYINKIVPVDLFKNLWCPEKARYSPKKKLVVEKFKNFKNINDIL